MTLNTEIFIKGSFDGADLHRWVNDNLLKAKEPQFKLREPGGTLDHWEFHNQLGQGFDAIFELDWWPDGTQWVDEYFDAADWAEEDRAEAVEKNRAQEERVGTIFGRIQFDTAYGFHQDGMGPTELHVSYIVRLVHEYFEPRGIDIIWKDEYSGDRWDNLNAEGLASFLNHGDGAMDWFYNRVSPILQAEVAVEGGTIKW